MKQNYILRLFLNLFKNPRVRVRKSSRLCHELGPVWRRRSAEQGGDWRPFCFFNTAWCCTFYQAIFASFLTDWLLICQPAAKAKGKPETGTLRKEPKKEEPKREPPKKEEPRKRDVSPEEKISRRKRHDSDEGENHRILILCVLLFLCNLVPIFFGAISVPIA